MLLFLTTYTQILFKSFVNLKNNLKTVILNNA
jgi:hypothetical protein